jgi:hypothetical protein
MIRRRTLCRTAAKNRTITKLSADRIVLLPVFGGRRNLTAMAMQQLHLR